MESMRVLLLRDLTGPWDAPMDPLLRLTFADACSLDLDLILSNFWEILLLRKLKFQMIIYHYPDKNNLWFVLYHI